MQYSTGVEYALHCLIYLAGPSPSQPVGIRDLAQYHGLSESYLSKIFTKLVKSGIVHSTPGVKGGYVLSKPPHAISFFDVIQSIEGAKPIFQCRNIIAQGKGGAQTDLPSTESPVPCRINRTMLEAEEQMNQFLKQKTLQWLKETLDQELPESTKQRAARWFQRGQ